MDENNLVSFSTDVDECRERTHNCHMQATCLNNIGNFSCHCNVGWSGVGTQCTG